MSIELERVIAGWNPESVVGLYDEHQADLHGFALAVTRDAGAAEELVQESFLRLVREHRAGRPPEDTRAWLFRVCTNLARSRFRRRAVADRRSTLLQSEEAHESAESTVIRSERHADLRRALGSLPRDARIALMLSAEGFSGHEIALALRRNDGATRTLLWRARMDLRRLLEREVAP